MSSPAASVSLADLQAPVRAELDAVGLEIHRIIEADFPLIREVNGHLLQMQGKLFRPMLVLLADRATGGRHPRAVTFAAVLELIHLATLVHDDAVDHSVLRRGMPTINALFTHQISVIMGDYLYSRAVVELVAMRDIEALDVIGRVTNDMTVGEMRQLLAHDALAFSEDAYDLLIRAKTASLLAGACEIGALAAEPVDRGALRHFGEQLGMAFQIVDDLLDYTGDASETGKPVGGDLREHKVTLPLIAALPRFSPGDRRQLQELMREPHPTDEQIGRVITAVTAAGGLDYARERAQRHAAAAEAALDLLPGSVYRDALRGSVGYVLERRR
ncbi:MAG: polyprenyl synthetase family protein [Gemmatimonadales bacterium]